MTPDTKERTHGGPHERDEVILELVVAPAGAAKFAARLDVRPLGRPCQSQPFGRHFSLDDAKRMTRSYSRHCQTMLGVTCVFLVPIGVPICHGRLPLSARASSSAS
jgi:hypothetical protein